MRYKLLRPYHLVDRLYPAGSIVSWDGPAGRYMEALDDEARTAIAAFEAKRLAQTGRSLKRQRTTNRVGMMSAAHSAATAPRGRPLWSGPINVKSATSAPKFPEQ
jgi:hypothetical protein